MQHVFIIGSRGLPASYGGFETFVEQLVRHQENKKIQYHVACLSETSHEEHTTYIGADCFTICPPKLGPARVIAYDMMAISYALKLIKENGWEKPVFCILGNTIGAFIAPFAKKIHAVGGTLLVNPDGLEWKRSKWSKPVQTYLKYSEKLMARHADLLVADNEALEEYLKETYAGVRTTFIAYGTDVSRTQLTADSPEVRVFFERWGIQEKEYYLILGRFVPENNYAVMLREFMASASSKMLIVICNHEGNTYFEQLKAQTGFEKDPRIQFVGTVYDKELLKYLRQEARAYLHGHEVGGTNPGLLEALAQTDENLVLGVAFNRKVALDTARYWSKEAGNLQRLIEELEGQEPDPTWGIKAREHMVEQYTWEKIARQYEDLFTR